jgi:methylenetetrahydrofolate--tRNA-(uracil-5-)-methyltransferase
MSGFRAGREARLSEKECVEEKKSFVRRNNEEKMMEPVTVIGAGLAGSECAWQLARRGIPVTLMEMKPERFSPAHHSEYFAELVCSNSLRSDELTNAVGLLKEEMRRLDSLIMRSADLNRVAAGGALAVDRVGFARTITETLQAHPNVRIVRKEAVEIPEGEVVIASGPLSSDAITEKIAELCPSFDLHFFDAVAPIVSLESIDMDKAYFASRYDKGTADYVNCPMEKDEYEAFVRELVAAEEAEVHGFDDGGVFEGCMPVEVMARRGLDTLRYGPLKPVGLRDPRTGKEAWAVVQLRMDNADGTLYNMVGFQTHLKWGEQKRVFSMIPGLENAEFIRYGVMHRNTYLNSPGLLDRYYRLISEPRISFAGQMTGVEGYVESAASGLLVGVETAARLLGMEPVNFPQETAIGALSLYISQGSVGDFQPMNVNFGIIKPLDHRVKGKRNKNLEISKRSLEMLDDIRKKEVFSFEDHH